MKYKFYIFFIILAITNYAQQGEQYLQNRIDAVLNNSFFESTSAAVEVYDLTANQPLYQKNSKLLLHPASNMKIFTSAAALLYLGNDYEFKTKLCYSGTIEENTLRGDIYVIGGFDPLFNTEGLDSLINAFSSIGIKKISGNIYADVSKIDSLFWGSGWMWDDDPSTDAPYLTSLNINGNSIAVKAEGLTTGSPAKITTYPSTNYVDIQNQSFTSDTGATTIYTERSWVNRSNSIIVKGNIRKGEEEVTESNLYSPVNYFLTLFKEKLLQSGITVDGNISLAKCPLTAGDIYTFRRSIDTVLIDLNKTSNNLNAEMIIRALAEKYFGAPASAVNGLKLIDSLVTAAGLNPSSYVFADGSGVSRYNLISAELITEVLKLFYYNYPELYKKLYNSFPIAGYDGTLRNRMKNNAAYNNVHAKTGTLSGVSSLSGYVTAANGNLLAFSILIQNHVKNNSKAMGFQNEICNILAEYK